MCNMFKVTNKKIFTVTLNRFRTSFWCFYYWLCTVDTRRKLNVHKTFRRRLGRLLNVLCTFNLRPMSTGWVSKYWSGISAKISKCLSIYFHFMVSFHQLLTFKINSPSNYYTQSINFNQTWWTEIGGTNWIWWRRHRFLGNSYWQIAKT